MPGDLDVVDETERDEVEPELGVDHLFERLVDILFAWHAPIVEKRCLRPVLRWAIVLLFLFLALPIAEIYVIIQVGDAIGVVPTLALLILDGFLGAALARSQGRAAWERFNRALTEGRVPARETFDGAMIILGGALLLAPGFITDVIGFALLLPPTRAVFRSVVARLRPSPDRLRLGDPAARRPGGAGPRPAGGRARGRPATTTTRAPRTRSTTRPPSSSRASHRG